MLVGCPHLLFFAPIVMKKLVSRNLPGWQSRQGDNQQLCVLKLKYAIQKSNCTTLFSLGKTLQMGLQNKHV